MSSARTGHGCLQHDRARVELGVDEVDGGAGDLDAVVERLALRVEAGKRRAAATGEC